MNEFIIVFRESLEACLIVGIIYTLLEKNNLDREIKQLWLGVFFALIASGILGILLNSIKQSIGNASIQALFESVFMFLTAGLLWYVIFWLSKHVSDRVELEGQTKKAIATSGIGVFLVVFFAILREGFETAIFLMGSFSILQTFSYIGFFTGMFAAILIGYFVVIQGRRINLRSFFQATTLLLVIFASGMVAYGTHEAEEFIVKGNHLEWVGLKEKQEIVRVWNILEPKSELTESENSTYYSYNLGGKNKYTHVMHDKGRIGVFLKGFFGYNSNPNWIEFILWMLSLTFGIRLWRKFYF
ncbi:MAG: iron permease FTR1 family protein [Gammaproteobacteria bacterium]|nr:iron permease FTR1 family protein [Gammaproteobacteria bacterium]|tara:strand:- start:122 stop:1021 length:900 start_codon:yes stop_codon:yes gene_type:complete